MASEKLHLTKGQMIELLASKTMLSFDTCKVIAAELTILTFDQQKEIATAIKTIAKGTN